MKLKSLLFIVCFALLSSVYADNRHLHPNITAAQAASDKKLTSPGYCEIELINASYDDVNVYGRFEDGATLRPFTIYSHEAPHYISLYYPDYGRYSCHNGMNLQVTTVDGMIIYSGYTYVDSTVTVYPGVYKKQLKAEVRRK